MPAIAQNLAATAEPRRVDGPTPVHVAIIMDGNGRWAAARGLPRLAGHRAGAQAVRRTIEAAIRHGVGWLTLYAFSSENWRRPATEVLDLTGLLRHYLRSEVAELAGQGVRLRGHRRPQSVRRRHPGRSRSGGAQDSRRTRGSISSSRSPMAGARISSRRLAQRPRRCEPGSSTRRRSTRKASGACS